jgi:hypothetical protein
MTYYYHDTDVIATTTYCGKPVRAVAKCNPEDEYDKQFGEDLALARLNLKVAKKRRARSYEKMYAAADAFNEACDFYHEMCKYNSAAIQEVKDGEAAIKFLMEQVKE